MTAYRPLRLVAALTFLSFVSFGCATSQDIVASPGANGKQYKSVYLVAHGDRSSDVDAAIQRELFRRGFAVRSLEIQAYDAKTSSMVASARWKNSPMHGFHGVDTVVSELVSGMLKKLGVS